MRNFSVLDPNLFHLLLEIAESAIEIGIIITTTTVIIITIIIMAGTEMIGGEIGDPLKDSVIEEEVATGIEIGIVVEMIKWTVIIDVVTEVLEIIDKGHDPEVQDACHHEERDAMTIEGHVHLTEEIVIRLLVHYHQKIIKNLFNRTQENQGLCHRGVKR